MKRILFATLILSTLTPAVLAGPRGEGPHHDDDRALAREAVRNGRALPLSEILSRLREQLGGQVVHVEIENEDGRLVYEFRVIGADGRLRRINVDAATAQILDEEGR